jgi:hypothetical protein
VCVCVCVIESDRRNGEGRTINVATVKTKIGLESDCSKVVARKLQTEIKDETSSEQQGKWFCCCLSRMREKECR